MRQCNFLFCLTCCCDLCQTSSLVSVRIKQLGQNIFQSEFGFRPENGQSSRTDAEEE